MEDAPEISAVETQRIESVLTERESANRGLRLHGASLHAIFDRTLEVTNIPLESRSHGSVIQVKTILYGEPLRGDAGDVSESRQGLSLALGADGASDSSTSSKWGLSWQFD